MKIRAILNNWKTADLMETGFSTIISIRRADNTPGWHHAQNSDLFPDIQLQFQSGNFRHILTEIVFSLIKYV